MDATNTRNGGRHRRRWRRRRHHRRSRTPSPQSTLSQSQSVNSMIENIDSTSIVEEFVENKMGLPPPYEQSARNSAPPPSYFGDNPPPPPGLVVPPAAPPRTTVIVSPPTTTGSAPAKLGPGPTGTSCPHCHKSIVTRVDFIPNNRTHIASAALCVLAGCCCGCIIPYCVRSCKTANHYCPQCRAFVGSYTPS